jgi:hypothetical protein
LANHGQSKTWHINQPAYDEAMSGQDTMEIPVQVNGKSAARYGPHGGRQRHRTQPADVKVAEHLEGKNCQGYYHPENGNFVK